MLRLAGADAAQQTAHGIAAFHGSLAHGVAFRRHDLRCRRFFGHGFRRLPGFFIRAVRVLRSLSGFLNALVGSRSAFGFAQRRIPGLFRHGRDFAGGSVQRRRQRHAGIASGSSCPDGGKNRDQQEKKKQFFHGTSKRPHGVRRGGAVMMFARSICSFIPRGRTLSRRSGIPDARNRTFLDLFNQAFYGIKSRLRVLQFAVLNGSPPARTRWKTCGSAEA